MKCYAIIDTNILVSALLSKHSDAATVQIVEKLISGEIIPLYSKDVLMEYHEVLRRKKFHFSEELVSVLIMVIEKYGLEVEPKQSGETLPDMKDLPFYEIVAEQQKNNTYLITGNIKHFPNKKFIVTPNEMLDILKKR